MIKIGILSFVRELNVGAALQAYALNVIMRSLVTSDCEVTHLDYSFKVSHSAASHFLRIRIRRCIQAMRIMKGRICNPSYFREYKHFVEHNIALSAKKYTDRNIACADHVYNALIVGSDQVWNGWLTNKSLQVFLLGFCKQAQRYSFAASFGKEQLFERYRNGIITALRNFEGISLREKIGESDIAAETGKEVRVHLDPTLLLDKEAYSQFIETRYVPQGKYIFVYAVARHRKLLDFVKSLQLRTGFTVVCSFTYKESALNDLRDIIHIKAMHPKQFISLVAGAEYVCTTSFHGTAFSIIFKKKFFAEVDCADGTNFRVAHLLEMLNLTGRAIENVTDDLNADPDYDISYALLHNKRDEARRYLGWLISNVRNG